MTVAIDFTFSLVNENHLNLNSNGYVIESITD